MGKGQKVYNKGGKKRTIKCPHCHWVRKMSVEACNKAYSRHMATAHPEEKFADPDDVPFALNGRAEEYHGGYDGCRSLPGTNGERVMGMVGQDADGNIQIFSGVSQQELFRNSNELIERKKKKKKKKKKRKTTAQKRFEKAKKSEAVVQV